MNKWYQLKQIPNDELKNAEVLEVLIQAEDFEEFIRIAVNRFGIYELKYLRGDEIHKFGNFYCCQEDKPTSRLKPIDPYLLRFAKEYNIKPRLIIRK